MTATQESYLNHFLGTYEKQVSKPVLDEVRDHYRMAITTAMTNGSSFDEALTNTHESFGGEHGVLSLEWPFQKSLVIRRRDDIEHALRRYTWGKKLPITIGIFLVIWWNNDTGSSLVSHLGGPGLFGFLLHVTSYYTEGMSKRANRLAFFLIVAAMMAYVLGVHTTNKSVHGSGNLYLIAGWSAVQTLLVLIILINFKQKPSPYLKRKEDVYGSI
ncbi:hypothetical protein [Fibrella forsythiae]|uniref:DUF1700 domain-containing protein n=1 Tax=Fibrella forsythiae TaxID=2817061 RepID=A0ABS3JGZ3_9BACT|nr:hypothetical protein [Fibrella forsythiae]MBO0949284.1 hypothetical protein [Fibrella forsythiae]